MRITYYITILLLALSSHIALMAQADDTPLLVAEQMPYFEGCDHYEGGSADKRKCSNRNLVNFISENIQYPEEAKSLGIEGTVFLSFVVDEYGSIESEKVLRDIGGGCAREALRILSLMPKWEPAINAGKPVKVQLNLPVTFSLKNNETTAKGNYQIHWGALKGSSLTKADLDKNISEQLLVRDEFGNNVDISSLTFIYQRNRTYLEETSTGKINDSLTKVVKKVKRGGQFTIVVSILVGGNFMEIERQFQVVG